MDEELNQRISQFIDNELSHGEMLSLLQAMRKQPQLQDKMARYEAISRAVKAENFLSAPADFTERVRLQIQHEPTHLLPRYKSFVRNYKMLALAASIAIVAVIASRDQYVHVDSSQTPAIAKAEQPVQEAPPVAIAVRQLEQEQFDSRINDYLQAHSDSVYINGQASFQSRARVVAYGRE